MRMLLSILVSLVPERYRRTWFANHDVDLQRGAMISAWAEVGIAAVVLIWGYPYYMWGREAMLERMAHATTDYDRTVVAYKSVSVLTFLEYLLLPKTILFLYMVVEGLVRGFARTVTGEVLPTMPLAVVSGIHGLMSKRHAERKLGPRIVDEVTPGTSPEFDLRIDSCREKPWNNLTTVEYQDQLYEVVKQLTGPPPRPWVYLLKKMPAGKIVRGIYHFMPEETMVEEEKL